MGAQTLPAYLTVQRCILRSMHGAGRLHGKVATVGTLFLPAGLSLLQQWNSDAVLWQLPEHKQSDQ